MYRAGIHIKWFFWTIWQKRKKRKIFPISVVKEAILGWSLEDCLEFAAKFEYENFEKIADWWSEKVILGINYSEKDHEKSWSCSHWWQKSYRSTLFDWNFRKICNSQCFQGIMLIMTTNIEPMSDHYLCWYIE